MIELGKIQTLTVIQFAKQGVYLSDGEEDKVLLPSGQVPKDCKEGDTLEVFIYKDSEDRLISTTARPALTLNQTALLPVKEVTPIGAFLDWGLAKDLLLPFKEQTREVKEGERLLVALYIDKSERLCATMQVYDYLSTSSPYEKEEHVTGTVYQIIENFGVYVAVDYQYSAMIPKKELHKKLSVGDVIEARITDVLPDGKLNLSLSEKAYIQMDSDSELIFECLETAGGFLPYHDKTAPEVIDREFDMSKAAFKRAIGRLYKYGKIKIEPDGIRLATEEEQAKHEEEAKQIQKEKKHQAAVKKYEPVYGRKHIN